MGTIRIDINTQKMLLDAIVGAEKLLPVLKKRVEEGKVRAEDSFLGSFYRTGFLKLPDSTAISDVRIKIDAMGIWLSIQKTVQ